MSRNLGEKINYYLELALGGTFGTPDSKEYESVVFWNCYNGGKPQDYFGKDVYPIALSGMIYKDLKDGYRADCESMQIGFYEKNFRNHVREMVRER